MNFISTQFSFGSASMEGYYFGDATSPLCTCRLVRLVPYRTSFAQQPWAIYMVYFSIFSDSAG